MREDRMLKVPEVAERLGVKPSTVKAWLREGKLAGFRLGGRRLGWRVMESDLESFVRAMRRGR
jgi:excisionase family DNA binding protein